MYNGVFTPIGIGGCRWHSADPRILCAPTKHKKARARRGRPSKHRAVEPRKHKSGGGTGSEIGATLGNWAEKGIRSLFGSGDYEVEAAQAGGFDVVENSIVHPMTSSAVPLMNSLDLQDGTIRVKHREFLGDISTGTATPNINAYYINPSNDACFPWLHTLANNFEQWIPHGIVFEFVSSCGNAVSSTNASLGTVSIATQYNIYSDAYSTKYEMLNSYFAGSAKTADNLMHAIECDPKESQTRIFNTYDNSSVPQVNGDLRMYYLGACFVVAQGSQANYTAGEMWITYDLSLLKPRVNKNQFSTELSDLLTADMKRMWQKEHERKKQEAKEESDYEDCADGVPPPSTPVVDQHTRDFHHALKRLQLRHAYRS